MNFNERLKIIRKRNRVTQQQISALLDINLRTYQRYESGTIEPPLANVMAIANFFHLPVDCLLGNGFFSNWEEILLHKDEILSYLQENIIFSDRYDLSVLTESQLANVLPAVFTKIIIDGSTIKFYSQIPATKSSYPLATNADEH